MTDDLIKAVARAMRKEEQANWNIELGLDEDVVDLASIAIRAAAPLILDMAADVVDDAEYAGFVRQLKERFQ